VAVQVGAEGVLVVNPGPKEVADAVVAEIRKLAGDKRVRLIPTQGRSGVAEYRDMLTTIRDRVQQALDNGGSLVEVKAARLARDYDGRYGAMAGPASADSFIDAAYRSQSNVDRLSQR
jgi:hypothetical protein